MINLWWFPSKPLPGRPLSLRKWQYYTTSNHTLAILHVEVGRLRRVRPYVSTHLSHVEDFVFACSDMHHQDQEEMFASHLASTSRYPECQSRSQRKARPAYLKRDLSSLHGEKKTLLQCRCEQQVNLRSRPVPTSSSGADLSCITSPVH